MLSLNHAVKKNEKRSTELAHPRLSVKHFVARQAKKPSGLFGRLFGLAMNKMNQDSIEWVIDMLDVKSDDKVLEIGYGAGHGIGKLANIISEGFIAGVDYSADMYKVARRKNKAHIDNGLVELIVGDAKDLNYPNNHFNKVFCVHVVYFWDNPLIELTEAFRVLQPGGKLAIFTGDKEEMTNIKLTQTGVYNLYDTESLGHLLIQTGFTDVQSFRKPIVHGPIAQGVCVVAKKP